MENNEIFEKKRERKTFFLDIKIKYLRCHSHHTFSILNVNYNKTFNSMCVPTLTYV